MGLFARRTTDEPERGRPADAGPDAVTLLETFQKGFFRCSGCGQALELGFLESLDIIDCPYCDATIFVPHRVGTYYLFRPLGGGGMGSVYQAVCEEYPGEMFAVKVLPRAHKHDQELIDLLCREAVTTQTFHDIRNCVNAVEYGFVDDEWFFATEYLAAPRLDQRIATHGKLDLREALRLGLLLLRVDAAILGRGYLYRDLKPENVLLGANREPCLIDFGLCLPVEQAAGCAPEEIEGSVHYLPPERVAGMGEDQRSEVYSLGMLLFHAITGETFFPDGPPAHVAELHVTYDKQADIPARMPPEAPSCVGSLLGAMMFRAPGDRLASLEEAEQLLSEVTKQCA